MSTMPERIRVIQYGLGPIGSAVARHVVERNGLELVGGVDIDPAKVGKDMGEVIGLGRPLGFVVAERLEQVLSGMEVDLVLHTTSSYFEMFKDQIIEILEAGWTSSLRPKSSPSHGWPTLKRPPRLIKRPNVSAKPCWLPVSTLAF